MGFIGLFFPWGVILQAVAIVHFVRRRPDTYWLWIILMGGGLGALVYIAAEIVPDANLLRGSLRVFPRRRRIRELERTILDNPAIGNYEELADLCLEEKQYARARQLYDRVIARRTDSLDPFYRRALAEIELNDFPAAVADLDPVIAKDPKYDFHRAIGLLAHALHASHRDLDALRDVLQLRLVPRRARTQRRRARVGAAHPREEADHAAVFAPTGTSLVSQGDRADQETAGRVI